MRGYTLIELLLATAIGVTLTGLALPLTQSTVDEVRTAAAARHLASLIATARIDAVRRSTSVGLRFTPVETDYSFCTHVDGNANGIRAAEILTGLDTTGGPPERLRISHPEVSFGLRDGLPDLDGGRGNADGVRIGSARIMSLAPNGTATSGTFYIRGRRSQYAVRVLGATGRVRVFHYDTGAARWNSR